MKDNVIALIPARGGSKGLPRKNLVPLGGYPLIAFSIAAARLSSRIERTIVSTDDEEIASVARKFGAEVPFLRPASIAGDKSTDMEFVVHALDWFNVHENREPEFLVHLRPTTPFRDPTVLDQAVDILRASPTATGLRSVHETAESPHKLFGMTGGVLMGLFPDDPRPEYYNLPRQAFPPVYKPNGYVDIISRHTVRRLGTLHGSQMIGFVTSDTGEIDGPKDLPYLEYCLSQYGDKLWNFLKAEFPKP